MDKDIQQVTSLIGDPVRASILWALTDGRAYTATELSVTINTSPQNMSMHLSKLIKGELLTVESQGRYKYYRIAKPEVAHALEAIACLVPEDKHKKKTIQPEEKAIRYCRSCYGHLAGKVGVLVNEALLAQKIIQPVDNLYAVTKKGEAFFADLKIDIALLQKQRRIFAKPCLDWSERKHHLAGSLGTALLNSMLELDYFRRSKNSRTILVTGKGQTQLFQKLKISV
ncbi:helix-turn-helix transcriptional regulator [Pseudoflavitalea sp. G-6-1-2]|uniref:ArsR/SmtB family transcription factor n=1 Tax=Pseudoflavitalea sp. G-6-1-2 TaxID=2728841 RepID=UPI00146E1D9C|nr:winged helix-turn-helix domain-containing protein [Pseudoflavitalea sp. G-6-1-2]NML22537.1 helix-turn-helix transcriptional regulator [Pseudoflavitalea sp. G-6-1-2]